MPLQMELGWFCAVLAIDMARLRRSTGALVLAYHCVVCSLGSDFSFARSSVRSAMFIVPRLNARPTHAAPNGAWLFLRCLVYKHDAPTALESRVAACVSLRCPSPRFDLSFTRSSVRSAMFIVIPPEEAAKPKLHRSDMCGMRDHSTGLKTKRSS